MSPNPGELVGSAEVAEMLGVKRSTVHVWVTSPPNSDPLPPWSAS